VYETVRRWVVKFGPPIGRRLFVQPFQHVPSEQDRGFDPPSSSGESANSQSQHIAKAPRMSFNPSYLAAGSPEEGRYDRYYDWN
jgi:hypothetical protein